MSGMGFNRNSMSNLFAYLFGDGSDGDLVVSADTNLTSVLNGDIVYRNYMNLTINSGCTLSVSNMCRGLWIRVRGTLTLNGAISMSNKGCYIAGGGSDLYLCYSDIKVPAVGGAGGVGGTGQTYLAGQPGANGTDGGCGGGGGGGYNRGGAGSAGGVFGGGTGAGGGIHVQSDPSHTAHAFGENGQVYGLRGGNGQYAVANGRGCTSGGGAGGVTAGASGGSPAEAGGVGSGGILIVIANNVVGSGQLLAKGANGGKGYCWREAQDIYGDGGSGGGSGGGSITLFYNKILSGTLTFDAAGGLGGAPIDGNNYGGGAGGAGSCRDYSLAELLSHTRV
jgi:hypothetical protein